MEFKVRQNDGVLCCDGSLDIGAVEAFRQTLAAALGQNSRVTLDLSGVTACDAAGLQLLYSARKQAETRDKQLQISTTSTAIQDASSTLGLVLDELMEGRAHV